ncbi:decaprenyl-phosphate phosphoribosyltransferase [Sulfurospirillum multivorans]|uniref:Decaprenyl-phosphate phosphoribosyltransferase n=2 Tax=Sulfurospirillum multivorans TaxID=66821 RepID=A0AA86ANT2_SULMK|nr:decaprenyl-phosphate phosphoribosyltransferase [Sulfurospirillum multivorans]AHJ13784.1 decaprenyl-phosphate phosphoribosyltransferase [Sulfurospirillum multivorans DSM 12446]QEH07274.1 decaprenyl-phosphate phosphoribosyltransferase [Sulfurospirillum multivorans]
MTNILSLMRLHQWIKNIFLFAPLFFTFNFQSESFLDVTLGFTIFCLAASSIYILNDYKDILEDQVHPTKKNRPLASGAVSKHSAISLMVVLSFIAVYGGFVLSPSFLAIVILYMLLNIAYTFKLKHISILDISIISIGFVLRVYAGATLINNTPSMWIVLVTFVLALFLALAKRRDDCLLSLEGKKTRKNIDGYNLEMVNAAMTLMAGVTVVSYIMYTVSPEVITRLGTHNLYLTSFFVVIGILRYMQLTFVEHNSGSPTKLVLKDRFLQLVLVGWLSSFYLIAKIFN